MQGEGIPHIGGNGEALLVDVRASADAGKLLLAEDDTVLGSGAE